MISSWTRPGRVAALAGTAVLGGALLMLAGLVAAPGPWTRGYVSEAGTTGMPLAETYRWGLVGLAVGVALLGGALRGGSRPAAILLGVAGLLAGTSGVVPCSAGCPLPPYEQTTVADVAHTTASILGMVMLAAAMALIALARPYGRVLRRLTAGYLAVVVPLSGVLGLTMLLAGRGALGAGLERALLVVAVSWLIGTAIAVVAGSRTHPEPSPGSRAIVGG